MGDLVLFCVKGRSAGRSAGRGEERCKRKRTRFHYEKRVSD